MIELERIDPEIQPKLSRLKAADPSRRLGKVLFAVVPYVMPTRRVKGVTLTKEHAGPVPVRVYRPENPSGAGLLWIHGGGLIGGVAKMDDEFCGRTALELGTTIVSVDYRLAPKHPFPAAHDDVHAGWTWFLNRAASFGVDPSRIAVGGQSAGGGLAAGLVQHLHDDGQRVAAQWLWTPMLDDRTALDAGLDAVGHYVWDNRANRYGWGSYLRAVDRQAPPPVRVARPAHGPDRPSPELAVRVRHRAVP